MQNRLGANTGSYYHHPVEQALEGIAAAGFRYVELAAIRGVVEHVPLYAGDNELKSIRDMSRRIGLTPVSLSGHSDLTQEAGIADARECMRICERLDIAILNTAVGGAFNEDEDESAFLANIQGLASEAQAMGITIALEIHGSLTGTGAKTRALVEKVKHPSVRINYDTANCEYFAGVRAEDDLPQALPFLAHCHLKDTAGGFRNWNFPALGEGTVDFAKLFGIFQRANYAGPFTVEIEFQGEPWPPDEEVNRAMAVSYTYLNRFGLS